MALLRAGEQGYTATVLCAARNRDLLCPFLAWLWVYTMPIYIPCTCHVLCRDGKHSTTTTRAALCCLPQQANTWLDFSHRVQRLRGTQHSTHSIEGQPQSTTQCQGQEMRPPPTSSCAGQSSETPPGSYNLFIGLKKQKNKTKKTTTAKGHVSYT